VNDLALPKEEARRWLEEAEYDLDTAQDNMEKERFNWACFIAQQAAEKAVKSIYVAREESAERIHSLAILIKGDPKRKISGVAELENLLENAFELDRHYVPTRYPNGVPYGKPFEFYSKRKAEECLECASKIISSCQTMLENM
jgi:HEPN domain-containing protein